VFERVGRPGYRTATLPCSDAKTTSAAAEGLLANFDPARFTHVAREPLE
jgi:hypothetical protein